VVRYFDGSTTRPQAVEIAFEGSHLVVRDEAGAELARWPLDEVHTIDVSDDRVRLACESAGAARLVVDVALLPKLRARCPNLDLVRQRERRQLPRILLYSAGAVGAIVLLLFVLIPAGAGTIAAWVPDTWQRKLGVTVRDQIIDGMGAIYSKTNGRLVCDAPQLTRAVAALAAQLASGVPRPVTVHVTVLDVPLVNAFALPGGELVLFRGLIDEAPTPEAVAGVLAHEIGHVVLRHPMELWVSRGTSALVIGLLAGDVFGFSAAAALGQILLDAHYGQDAEAEADALAVEMMNGAGIDARPMARLFEQFAREEGDAERLLSYFSSHPPSAERAAAVIAATRSDGRLDPEIATALGQACEEGP